VDLLFSSKRAYTLIFSRCDSWEGKKKREKQQDFFLFLNLSFLVLFGFHGSFVKIISAKTETIQKNGNKDEIILCCAHGLWFVSYASQSFASNRISKSIRNASEKFHHAHTHVKMNMVD